MRDTAATLDPINELRSWDFPALGAPTKAMSSRLRGLMARCCGEVGGDAAKDAVVVEAEDGRGVGAPPSWYG